MSINEEQAIKHIMDLLSIDGPSGGESPVAERIKEKLLTAGCAPSWFHENVGKENLPEHFEIGNLIVKIPGTIEAPRIMFSAHMDTVPLCKGAIPLLKEDCIVSKGKTALGADNRAAVAAIVTMVEVLLKTDAPRPPISLLFTVGEENGMHGAKAFELSDANHPVYCFNLDGSGADAFTGALGAARWKVTIHGKSVHAAAQAEAGISSAVIAAFAITEATQKGYFGRIAVENIEGTANIGVLHGGEANNQVMDHLIVTGECRSHSQDSLEKISKVWKTAFENAAREVINEAGEQGSIDWKLEHDYPSFKLENDEPVIQRFLDVAEKIGQKRSLTLMNAGLDANTLNKKGIPTLSFGAGCKNAHSLNELVELPRFFASCELIIALATNGYEKE